jgi:hypothetical protein
MRWNNERETQKIHNAGNPTRRRERDVKNDNRATNLASNQCLLNWEDGQIEEGCFQAGGGMKLREYIICLNVLREIFYF